MEFFLAVAFFTCDANERLVSRVKASQDSDKVKLELIQAINDETDKKCFEDAND